MSKTLQYWRNCDLLTLVEAALLIIEEYPDDWVNGKKLLEEPRADLFPFIEVY